MAPLQRSAAILFVLLAFPVSGAHAASTPLPDAYVANGPVNAIAVDGQGRAYIGGAFDRVGPRTGHALALTTASSTAAAGFPDVNGPIYAAVPDGSGGWFIGGAFDSVGGVARSRIAHLSADGTVDPDWDPHAKAAVRSLVLEGTSLYVGGDFFGSNSIAGTSLSHVAKLSTTGSGAADPAFQPGSGVFGGPQALAIIGANLYVGGFFGSGTVMRLDKNTGEKDVGWGISAQGPVSALAASGTDLIMGGSFPGVNGSARYGIAKINTAASPPNTVDPAWDPGSPGADVRALLVSGTSLYVGGGFATMGGQTRYGLAKLSLGTGNADSAWNPGGVNGTVLSLALSDDGLIVGGSFSTAGLQSRYGLAKVDPTGTGTVDAAWNPNMNGPVEALAAAGTSVLAGGSFSGAGPQTADRVGLARLNPDGTLDTGWSVNIGGGEVDALVLSGTDLYVGGAFATIGGASRLSLAKLSTLGSGSVDPAWSADVQGPGVNALALSGSDLFVGGQFIGPNSIGGQTRGNLAKLSAATGVVDPTWDPEAPGTVRALVVNGGDLYVGGDFHGLWSPPGGSAFAADLLAKVSTTGVGQGDGTWAPTPNNIVRALAISGTSLFVGGQFSAIGATPASRIAKLALATGNADTTWLPAGANSIVFSLVPVGSALYVGGIFSSIGGVSRGGLARVAQSSSGAVDPDFAPPAGASTGVDAIAVAGPRLFAGGPMTGFGALSSNGYGLFDLTGPSVSVVTPIEGGRYRQDQMVGAGFSCDDPDGGGNVASCAGPVANGAALDTASSGAHTFTVTATDAGGNTAATTVNYVVDASAPTVAVTAPAAGVTYAQGQVVEAAYSCGDADHATDVASCAGPVASGAPIDTSTGGLHNFTVTATDQAGNATTTTTTYAVSVPAVPAVPAVPTAPHKAAAPRITGWEVLPAHFRAAKGARVGYALSKAATLKVTVLQVRKGKAPKVLGSFSATGKAGANRFHFSGKVAGKRLKPGRYRLSAQATDAAGNPSNTVVTSFRIARR